MQRSDNLSELSQITINYNQQAHAAAVCGDHQTVAVCLAHGASLISVVTGYKQADNSDMAQRLASFASYITLLQFHGYSRSVVDDMRRVFLPDFTVDAASLAAEMQRLNIYCDNEQIKRAAEYGAKVTEGDVFAVPDFFAMLWDSLPSVCRTQTSRLNEMTRRLFSDECYTNPQIALRCLSAINNEQMRVAIYRCAALLVKEQQLTYFFSSIDESQFLLRAQNINRLMREHQLDFDKAFFIVCSPGLLGWLQAMIDRASLVSLLPYDISRLVAEKITTIDCSSQFGHKLLAYQLGVSTAVPVPAAPGFFSSLSNTVYGMFSSSTSAASAAAVARPESNALRR